MRLLLVEGELEMATALSAALGRYDMILDQPHQHRFRLQ